MSDEISCKGNMFVSAARAMTTLSGAAFVENVRDRMKGEGGPALREGTILSSGWYPIAWYREFLGAAAELESREYLHRMGIETAKQDVSTIHRIMFRVLTPRVMLKQTSRLLRLYYSAGDANVVAERDGYASIRYVGFVGFDVNVWQDFLGGSTTLLALTGARDVAVRVLGGGLDSSLSCEVTWK